MNLNICYLSILTSISASNHQDSQIISVTLYIQPCFCICVHISRLFILYQDLRNRLRFILALCLTVRPILLWCGSSWIIPEEEKSRSNLFHARACGRLQRHQLNERKSDSVQSNLTSVVTEDYLVRIVSDKLVNQQCDLTSTTAM